MFKNFIELVQSQVRSQPKQIAYTYLSDYDATLSYEELDRQARTIALCLQQKKIKSGDRALLIYPNNLEFITAFFGCLYAGVIAVPVYWQNAKLSAMTSFFRLIKNTDAGIVLTTTLLLDKINRNLIPKTIPAIQWLATDGINDEIDANWNPPDIKDNALAFLQYTSGSTTAPKGVMVSHQNIINNSALISKAFSLHKDDKIVSWLPFYHDMGLIGAVLQPVYSGIPCIIIPSSSFLQSPFYWLQTITKQRATVSGGPNFAYNLCVQKINPAQKNELDLSCWRVAFNGAEPIQSETLETFAGTFGDYGFKRNSFYPCYGLAEGTLLVSGGKIQSDFSVIRLSRSALENCRIAESNPGENEECQLVSSGRINDDHQTIIVNTTELMPCEQDEIGEIWIAGPSVSAGYWNNSDLTRETFQAYLANGEGPFLRTGDLGFLRDGELFVTARLKDLIIIRGQNYYPQDIEKTAEESHHTLRRGGSVAFSIEFEEEERLVVIQEINFKQFPDTTEVINLIRKEIGMKHGLFLFAILLVRPGSLPKTSSGKIQRFICKNRFLQDSLQVVDEWRENTAFNNLEPIKPPHSVDFSETNPLFTTNISTKLNNIWSEVIGNRPTDGTDNFFTAGGNSLSAMQVVARLNEAFAKDFPYNLVFETPVFADLVKRIEDIVNTPSAQMMVPFQKVTRKDELPLSFAQEQIWFQEQMVPGNPFYNITLETRLKGTFNIRLFEESVEKVLQRHEILRAIFFTDKGIPFQSIKTDIFFEVRTVDLSNLQQSERQAEIARLRSETANTPFDFATGPFLKAQLLQLAADEQILLLSTHHIVCDGWGISILIKEINAYYSALINKQPPVLPSLNHQYVDFALWQKNNSNYQKEALYWQNKLKYLPSNNQLPTDFEKPRKRNNQGSRISSEFTPELTADLKKFSTSNDVTLFMVMLWALKILIHRWTGEPIVAVGTVVANRNSRDVENLIGCFMNFIIFCTDFSGEPTARQMLERVKINTLEGFANRDYPFQELVKALNPSRNQIDNPLYNVGLWVHNYPVEQLFEDIIESETQIVDTQTSNLDLRVIVTETSNGTFKIDFEFASQLFESETISALSRSFLCLLETFCRNPDQSISKPLLDEKIQHPPDEILNINIISNFTAQPIDSFLSFWLEKFEMKAFINSAPYNQIFQYLLEPRVLPLRKGQEVNIFLISLEHWFIIQSDIIDAGRQKQIEEIIGQFTDALKSVAHKNSGIYLIGICPSSPEILQNELLLDFFERIYKKVLEELSDVNGVYLIDLNEASRLYKVERIHDAFTDELGNIPFTPEFFAAIGTFLLRKLFVLLSPPYKLIALDCDQTLWKGICAEDTYEGIEITSPYKSLQEFMLRQKERGLLLALCSRNNESDVVEVFQNRPDMVLKLDDIAALYINWDSKPENLRKLAEDLQISLDSIVFFDDDPVVCAEIREKCPEVLTLQLPPKPDEFPRFLEHIWVLDGSKTTTEDKHRTLFYRQNREREQIRQKSLTLAEFLTNLELRVVISEMQLEHLERVAQLSQRVNQFNTTEVRHSPSEIIQLICDKKCECWTVEVSDNFGDYGMVGVIIFAVESNILRIRKFLLSCRALGRNVEFEMLKKITRWAIEHDCSQIEVLFSLTKKNIPALKFFEKVYRQTLPENETKYRFRSSVEEIRVQLEQKNYAEGISSDSETLSDGLRSSSRFVATHGKSEILAMIARDFWNAGTILKTVNSKKQNRSNFKTDYTAPNLPLEIFLADLWSEILGLERIGIHDNFFEFGGHSLLATRLLSRVHDEFQVGLNLYTLFENPTISSFSKVLANKLTEEIVTGEILEILGEIEKLDENKIRELINKAE